ncbi:hypothetical protein BV22DRAFT_419423 [Leucogyrophana mollusca]|uniref:Uncharacterized protein n=1 Tax=Leucogyrophana mollusca TaxID=85980 RepID=A0ACB8BJZ2_9AGAM|nr:hypothetical protein BV22DRAFT_419423 [Leucogyrophana mollusca]
MAPRSRAPCQICEANESKYTCAACKILYCSVPCYKQHKESCTIAKASTPQSLPSEHAEAMAEESDELMEPKPLRPLTSLNWPYVPEESAYPDPLKRDDPKPLQLHQYEAIATAPSIRSVLEANPRLPELLTSIDKLRGSERENALQRALGVDSSKLEISQRDLNRAGELDDDTRALRQLAEAVEAAVRGGKESALGLDWDD